MFNLASSLNGLRVLVVDSDPDARYLLTTLFAGYGVETFAATSAETALKILQQAKPDLLISEINLPDEDGYSFVCKVKALAALEKVDIPAIALTVFAKPSDREQALAAGFRQHLAKPVDIDQLIAIVARLICPLQLLPV